MKSIHLFCLLICVLIGQACKENSTSQKEEAAEVNKDTTASQQTSTFSGGHDNNFLTDDLLHYKAAFTIGKDPKENPYAGQWIDLDPNGKFKAGTFGNQTHTGRWDYNEQTKVLLLRPDNGKFKTSEWKVQHSNDMILWVGTPTYVNNATQIQLVRSKELPVN